MHKARPRCAEQHLNIWIHSLGLGITCRKSAPEKVGSQNQALSLLLNRFEYKKKLTILYFTTYYTTARFCQQA